MKSNNFKNVVYLIVFLSVFIFLAPLVALAQVISPVSPSVSKFTPDVIMTYTKTKFSSNQPTVFQVIRANIDTASGQIQKDIIATERFTDRADLALSNGDVYVAYNSEPLNSPPAVRLATLPKNDASKKIIQTVPFQMPKGDTTILSLGMSVGQRNGSPSVYIAFITSNNTVSSGTLFLAEYYNNQWKVQSVANSSSIYKVSSLSDGLDIKLYTDANGNVNNAEILFVNASSSSKKSIELALVIGLDTPVWTPIIYKNWVQGINGWANSLSDDGLGVAYSDGDAQNPNGAIYYKHGAAAPIKLSPGNSADISGWNEFTTIVSEDDPGDTLNAHSFFGSSFLSQLTFKVGVKQRSKYLNFVDLSVNSELVGLKSNSVQFGSYYVAAITFGKIPSQPNVQTFLDLYPVKGFKTVSNPILVDSNSFIAPVYPPHIWSVEVESLW